MVLQTTCIAGRQRKSISRVVSLAPAATAADLKWKKMEIGRDSEIRIIYSQDDWILRFLFPVGEFKTGAVGFNGVLPPACPAVGSFDVTKLNGVGVGHLDYRRRLYDIFEAAGLTRGSGKSE